jgi:hypothetical protein
MDIQDSEMVGCFGLKHSTKWCSFLMISLISWFLLIFSVSMIILYVIRNLLGLDLDANFLIIWTNLLTIVIGIWIPQPKRS